MAKQTPKRRTTKRSPAEAERIWDDGEGGLTVAPTSARAHRVAMLGDGIAALHIADADTHAELIARHADAWHIKRRDESVTMLVRHTGPAFRVAGASVQTMGAVDLGGAGAVREPGEIPPLRWYA